MKLRPDLELVVLVDKRSTGMKSLGMACSGCVYYYPGEGVRPSENCMTMSTKCMQGPHLIWKERINAEA